MSGLPRAIADGDAPLTEKSCKLSLAGLGRGFELLHRETGQPMFRAAQAACGRLGLALPELDPTARGYFEKHANAQPAADATSHDADLRIVQEAVARAADEMALDNDPEFFEQLLEDPELYRYRSLLEAVRAMPGRPEHRRARPG